MRRTPTTLVALIGALAGAAASPLRLNTSSLGATFDGVGALSGGGATSVLLRALASK